MSEKITKTDQPSESDIRKKRRAEQLRANLMRRKVQTRSRRAGDADERTNGIAAAENSAVEAED